MSSVIKNTKNLANEVEVDDRRHDCPTAHQLWSKLSVAQQASVSSMHNFGYELNFIRNEGEEMLVVMLLNEAVIVIDDEGTIDTQVSINIRK